MVVNLKPEPNIQVLLELAMILPSTLYKVINNHRPNYNRDQTEFLLTIKATLLHRN